MVDHQSNQSLIRIFQKLVRITAHTFVLKKKKKLTRFNRILQEILVGFMTKIRTLFHFYLIFYKCRLSIINCSIKYNEHMMGNKTNSFKQCNDAANILLVLMSYFLLLTKFNKYLKNTLFICH